MGGGDLNSKKSWHPNTIKNQERVWKAEQLAIEEKKRIAELQKERAEERDREELNALANHNRMASTTEGEVRLSWMYDKPDKKVQAEDYLLGKSLDSKIDGPSREEGIPTVSRRVAGASMVGGSADGQVDLVRKMREDPLLLVQERERAARAALLNNPIQRKKLTELLRQDQEKKQGKSKASKAKDIDNLLASKLNALGGQNSVDLAALLASGDSSDDSSSDSSSGKRKKKKKKSKKSKKNKKLKHKEQEDSSEESHKCDKNSKEKIVEKLFSTYKDHKTLEDTRLENEKKRKDLKKYRSPERTNSRLMSRSPDYRSRKEDRRRKSPETRERREEVIKRRSPERVQNRRSPPRYWERKDEPVRKKTRNTSEERAFTDEYKPRLKRSPDREQNRKSPPRYRDGNDKAVSKKSRMTSEERAARLLEMVRVGADNEYKPRIKRSPDRLQKRRSTPVREGKDKAVGKKSRMTSEERAARLLEMVRAGADNEARRGERVAAQRVEPEVVSGTKPTQAHGRILPTSLEARIQSNRHNIQRNKTHMNEHFARR